MIKIKTAVALLIGLLVAAAATTASSAKNEKMTIVYSSGPTAYHAWALIGVEQGIFAKHGIDLNVIGGAESGIKANLMVATGNADAAIADFSGTVSVNGRYKTSKVKAIFVLEDKGSDILISKKKINNLDEINGLDLAANPNASSSKLLKLATDAKPNFINVPLSYKELSFVRGEVTAFATFSIKAIPTLVKTLGVPFEELNITPLASRNSWAIGNVVSMNTEYLEKNPELAKKFVAASKEAITYCIANKDECIKSMERYAGASKVNYDTEMWRLNYWWTNYAYTDAVKSKGLSYDKTSDLTTYAFKMNDALDLPQMPLSSYYVYIK